MGSTELVFILVMALVFFGPRKLPQISRSLGKSLAEFRRASDEFKRTWEREVALEKPLGEIREAVSFDNIDQPATEEPIEPRIEAISDQRSVARLKETDDVPETPPESPTNKREWL